MSLTDMVIMPGADYQAACDAIREKTEGVGYIRSGDMAELIRSIETGGGNVQHFTLPIGRSRGDVNGDGLINVDDISALQKVTSTTDEVSLWCADANANGSVNNADILVLSAYLMGNIGLLTSAPTFSDYYNNWTYYKTDDYSGYFYIDIPIEGVTESSKVTMLVPSRAESITDVICADGSIRVVAKCCPGIEMECALIIDENGIVWNSTPMGELSTSGANVCVDNNANTTIYYFSKNYPIGTTIPANGELNDTLSPNDLYAVLYNSSEVSRARYTIGDGYALSVGGGFSDIYFNDESSPSDGYDQIDILRVDVSASIKLTFS